VAYDSIAEAEKKAIHWQIGQLLLSNCEETKLAENIFTIVNHLNFSADSSLDRTAKIELIRLNLAASRSAKAIAAYTAALDYLNRGIQLLPIDAWTDRYELCLSLYRSKAEYEYLTANFDAAEATFDLVIDRAKTNLEKAEIYNTKTVLYIHKMELEKALKNTIIGLQLCGFSLPEQPADIQRDLRIEMELLQSQLVDKLPADLVLLPTMADLEQRAISQLLVDLCPVTFFINQDLFRFVVIKLINISLQAGNTTASCFAYAVYGMFLGILGEFAAANEFGNLALVLADKIQDIGIEIRTKFVVATFVSHWVRHAKLQ
jgi:predicted ATPase